MSNSKLPRSEIAKFIPNDRGIRAFEDMQSAVSDAVGTLANADVEPTASALATLLEDRIARLEQAQALAPIGLAPQRAPDLSPPSLLPELLRRIAALEQLVGLMPQPQPLPVPAPNGTYASPTSITINGGVITAIS